jgi:hypothetical protein
MSEQAEPSERSERYERELLRLHLEAVWGIHVPPIVGRSVDLDPDEALPPWELYLAHFGGIHVAVWRPDVLSTHRVALLRRGHDADPVFNSAIGMRRETVFQPPTEPTTDVRHTTRLLTEEDISLIEEFEAESASYYLDSAHTPCFGVILDGRLTSVSHSSRRTTEACELGIETLPHARRQGCAHAATLAWTRAIRAEGLIPLYSAFTRNTASLRLAVSCGYAEAIAGAYGPMQTAN